MTIRATALALLAALAVSPAALAVSPAAADQNDPGLDDLFERLLKAPDLSTVQPIEADIWQLWYAHEDTAVQILMQRGAEAMGRGDPRSAMTAYDQVVAIAPGFAEGWNRRATLNYMIGDYQASLADIDKTLALEPRHFGALSGRGLVHAQLEEWNLALESFEAALQVHPTMTGPRRNLEAIRRRLKEREIRFDPRPSRRARWQSGILWPGQARIFALLLLDPLASP